MTTLKEQFHTIANWHNKITIAAGTAREFLRAKPLVTLTKEELKAQQENLVALLDKIESDAVATNQKVMALKDIIYKKINPDIPTSP